MKTFHEDLRAMTADLLDRVIVKDIEYGASWKKRGGVGAFMMLARKWDRLENALDPNPTSGIHSRMSPDVPAYDVLFAGARDTRPEGIIDDIDDLVGYLLLVRTEIYRSRALLPETAAPATSVPVLNFAATAARFIGDPAIPGRNPEPRGFDKTQDT
jgi:hypothetical protein